MSKEFEEIVLKKLDALDERTKNIEKELKFTQEEIRATQEEIRATQKEVRATQEDIKSIHNELKATQETVQNLSENVKDLNNRFTVFDFEMNQKIGAIFDAITVNNEKHDLFEKSIVSLNTKTFNHDIRISVLEDYSKNAKLFATS